MLEIEVNEAVKKFVKTFRVARKRQLNKFFSDREKGVYEHTIKQLLSMKILHEVTDDDDIVSLVHPDKLPSPIRTYNETLSCLDMLTGILTASEVVWFDVADYPLNMRFLTVADEAYDVTYIDNANWIYKYGLLEAAWKKCVPPGQEDPFNHIAVVPSLEVAQKLRELPFTQFVVVNWNGAILG